MKNDIPLEIAPCPKGPVQKLSAPSIGTNDPITPFDIALLTGGGDKPYALGLASSLVAQEVGIDFIGSNEVNAADLLPTGLVRSLPLRGDMRPNAPALQKLSRIIVYYFLLVQYAATTRARVFHLLWNNKFELFDRTVVMFFYRLLGKRLVFTVHNVNAGKRDGNDSFLNRLTLRMQYQLVHHLFVHTEQMKRELQSDFALKAEKISVIPFGINSTVPNTELTRKEARAKLGLDPTHKVLLFFGNIAPYKGLDYLVESFSTLVKADPNYRLIVAGRPKSAESYWAGIQGQIDAARISSFLIQRIEYIPDEETEIFFKAADVFMLPYTHIFQSGVLFLGYNFGLPVIASNVGSLKEDIREGKTGFICEPRNSAALAKTIAAYFASDLYYQLDSAREQIRDFAEQNYSWTKVSQITRQVYDAQLKLAERKRA